MRTEKDQGVKEDYYFEELGYSVKPKKKPKS